MNAYLSHALELMAHLRSILLAIGNAEQIPNEDHMLFLERFDTLITELSEYSETAMGDGQEIIVQIFHRYPQIAHLIPRDLMWFFGGDCLHYMPDEEIALYQELEERRFIAEEQNHAFNWPLERNLLFMQRSEHRLH